MNVLRQVLEILRDLGIILGIPMLIGLLLRMTKLRVDILKDQMDSLKQTYQAEIEFLKQTQYPNMLIILEAQEKLYKKELEQLRQQRQELQVASAPDSQRERSIEKDIENIGQSLAILERLRWNVNDAIESDAVRKFELFCKDITDPNAPTADHIFSSVTYGHGISSVQASLLERRGFIENKDGNVRLTEKGKEIWRAVRNLERQRD
jgi:hypothetical protein